MIVPLFGILIGGYAASTPHSLTLLLSIFFFLEGIQKIFFAMRLRPKLDWTWVLASGIVSLIISPVIWALPLGSPLVGVMVRIDLIESGLATIAIAHAMRKTLEKHEILCVGEVCSSPDDKTLSHWRAIVSAALPTPLMVGDFQNHMKAFNKNYFKSFSK